MSFRRLSTIAAVMALCVFGWASVSFSPLSARAQERDITINGDDENRMIDCNGSAVSIHGDDNNIRLQGECSKLTVSGDDNNIDAKTVTEISIFGDDNVVRVETVAKISAIGDDNKVTWTKGAGDKLPEVSDTGDDNRIRQAGK